MTQPFNPYRAPQEDAEQPTSLPSRGTEASTGKRFANLLLDQFFMIVMVVVAAVVLGGGADGEDAPGNGLTWLMMLGYYLFFEGVFGVTPAKLITKTRVVRLDGSKPSFAQILGRTFARFVPFEPFSFFGGSAGWHDRWSKTAVVNR
jgi:uncharacterized RDD family membrane protein YckC